MRRINWLSLSFGQIMGLDDDTRKRLHRSTSWRAVKEVERALTEWGSRQSPPIKCTLRYSSARLNGTPLHAPDACRWEVFGAWGTGPGKVSACISVWSTMGDIVKSGAGVVDVRMRCQPRPDEVCAL